MKKLIIFLAATTVIVAAALIVPKIGASQETYGACVALDKFCVAVKEGRLPGDMKVNAEAARDSMRTVALIAGTALAILGAALLVTSTNRTRKVAP